MFKNKKFKCVNCGVAAAALYRNYGPSVLKLTKCENCKGIVDKYIEYDPVIVVIDLVLMSQEAQRHIIYNTEFKSYWKLFIILIMLETYGVWRSDSLFNIAVDTICGINNNATHIALPINVSVPEPWGSGCRGWARADVDVADLFIWEKDFYIHFLSTLAGMVVFIATIHITMKTFCTLDEVPFERLVRSVSLAHASLLFCVPALVWGAGAPPAARLHRYLLVHAYGALLLYNVLRVLYAAPRTLTVLAMVLSGCGKLLAVFHATPAIRAAMEW